jgi:putative glutamine amidotransferase
MTAATASPSPLILVSPSTQQEGAEFHDLSLSLSKRYTDALLAVGAMPIILPPSAPRPVIAELVRRSDGVLLTGGDDIQPELYDKNVPADLAKTVREVDRERDAWELELIDEVFKQHKPFLGICRGHQLVNVALGGTLIIDIPSQVPNAVNHRQFDRKADPVHDLQVTRGSLLDRLAQGKPIAVNSTHHQAIGKLAGPLTASARTADGIVEAVELKSPDMLPFFLAVQFHPERLYDRFDFALNLFRCFAAACAQQQKRL